MLIHCGIFFYFTFCFLKDILWQRRCLSLLAHGHTIVSEHNINFQQQAATLSLKKKKKTKLRHFVLNHIIWSAAWLIIFHDKFGAYSSTSVHWQEVVSQIPSIQKCNSNEDIWLFNFFYPLSPLSLYLTFSKCLFLYSQFNFS